MRKFWRQLAHLLHAMAIRFKFILSVAGVRLCVLLCDICACRIGGSYPVKTGSGEFCVNCINSGYVRMSLRSAAIFCFYADSVQFAQNSIFNWPSLIRLYASYTQCPLPLGSGS